MYQMSTSAHKEMRSVQAMQPALTHTALTDASAGLVTLGMAFLVTVSCTLCTHFF